MAEGKTVVVPLTGPNYCTWKIQCKMSLMRDGLWGIVSKTEDEPEAGRTERHTKFVTRRDRALAIIVRMAKTTKWLQAILDYMKKAKLITSTVYGQFP